MIANVILLIFFSVAAFKGYQKGFLLEVISLLSFFLAVYGGFKMLDFSITLLAPYRDTLGGFLPVAAFIIVFVMILVALNLAGRMFKKIIDFTLLGSVDNLAGAVLGVLKMAFFLSVINWVFVKMGFQWPHRLAEESFFYGVMASVAPKTAQALISLFPSLGILIEKIGHFLKTISH